MVHQKEIEISRRSIDAINKIVAPTNKTELQSLIGKINFIKRFISNLSGKMIRNLCGEKSNRWPWMKLRTIW